MSAVEIIGTVVACLASWAAIELAARRKWGFLTQPEPQYRVRLSSPDDESINFGAALRPVGGPPSWETVKRSRDVTASGPVNTGGNSRV